MALEWCLVSGKYLSASFPFDISSTSNPQSAIRNPRSRSRVRVHGTILPAPLVVLGSIHIDEDSDRNPEPMKGEL